MGRNIVSGVLSVVTAKVATLLVGLVTTPLLYRLLGPAKFGAYTTVLSTHALFMILVSAGISSGVRKYVAEQSHGPEWEANVVGFYFRLAVALAVAGAAVYLLATRFGIVAWLFSPAFVGYFTLMTLMVFAAQLWGFARRALMGFGQEHRSEPLLVVYRLTFAVVALALVSLGYGVVGALSGHVVATTLVAAVGLALVTRRIPVTSLFTPAPSRFPRRRLLTFNLMTVLLTFFLTSLYHVDVIMLQSLRGSQQVGNYKAALTLAEFLWFVPLAIQTVYVHSTSELWSRNRLRQIGDLTAKTTRYTLLLTLVMALGLASLADIVVPLYWGPGSTPAIEPLLLLLPGAVGFAAVRPTLAIEQGHGKLRFALVATGAAAVLNLTLNALLIPPFGMRGAAVATSVGYGSMLAFHVWSTRKLGVDPLVDARLGRIALTTAVAAVPIFLLPASLSDGVTALLVVPPVGLTVFLTAAFLTGALAVDEVVDLLSSFPHPVGTAATRFRNAVARFRTETGARTDSLVGGGVYQWLFVVGLLLFVGGLAVSALSIVGAPTNDMSTANATNGTTTTQPAVTPDTTTTSVTSPPTPTESPTTVPTETTTTETNPLFPVNETTTDTTAHETTTTTTNETTTTTENQTTTTTTESTTTPTETTTTTTDSTTTPTETTTETTTTINETTTDENTTTTNETTTTINETTTDDSSGGIFGSTVAVGTWFD